MMKLIGVTTLLLLSFLLVAPLSHAQTDESVRFQNWSVTCGDDKYCTATTADQNKGVGALTVRRHNDKKANWEISIQTNEKDQAQFRPLALRIAGQRLQPLTASRDYSTFSKPNEFFLIHKPSLNLLFRRMIESRRMFFTFGAGNQQRINASYSLNGLSDSLTWIDEKQDRIGSRRTVEPPVERATPKAEPVPFNAEAIATKEHRKTLDPSLCDLDGAEIYSIGVIAEPLDEKSSLVVIPCFSGTDNTASRIFVVDKESQKATLQLWATFSAFTGWVGTDLLSNVNYDQETKQLTMHHKGRSTGDCGISGIWLWHEDSRFEMKEFLAKDVCDEKEDNWPVIFPHHSENP